MGPIGKLSVLAVVIGWPCDVMAQPLPGAADGYVLWVNASPSAKDCPGAPDLAQRIAARLKSDPFVDAAHARQALHVSFTHEDGVYHAYLSVRTASEVTKLERHFDGPAKRCNEVAEATVLGATLLIEGAAELTNISDGTEGAEVASKSEEGQRDASTQRDATLASATPSEASSSNAAGKDSIAPPKNQDNDSRGNQFVGSEWWLMPVMSRGVVSSNGLAWGMGIAGLLLAAQPWGVSWGADYLASESVLRGQTRYRFSQSTVFVDAALRLPLARRVAVTPELGVMFGVTHAAVITRDPTDPGDFPFLGMQGGGRLSVALVGPLALGCSGRLRIPFARHIFRAAGLQEAVWKQPRLGFSAELGLGLTFD